MRKIQPQFASRSDERVKHKFAKLALLSAPIDSSLPVTLKASLRQSANDERKRLNVHTYGRAKVNLRGSWEPKGNRYMRCK